MMARLAPDARACAPLLARALPHFVDGPAELTDLGDAAVFEVLQGGHRVGAFALEITSDTEGHHITVLAAGAEPGFKVLPTMVAAVEREAREHVRARTVGCFTRRPGLRRLLQRAGWLPVASHELRKAL